MISQCRKKTVTGYVIVLRAQLQFNGLSTLKEMQEQKATHVSEGLDWMWCEKLFLKILA